MPTYEYKCDACHAEFEREQHVTDDPDPTCVVCGLSAARRMISSRTGFALKGGGWFTDGYSSTRSG